MLEFLAKNLYLVLIMVLAFMMLYLLGGEDIIFFKKKKYNIDPKAEENLMAVLNKYARLKDFKVLGRTTLRFKETELTFDAIVLSYYGTIAFANDPHGGQIYGEGNAPDWTQIFEGHKIHFSNPLYQLSGCVRFFREIYRAENVKFGQTDAMVVFTNRDVSVAAPATLPVCYIGDLKDKLTGAKYSVDNGAEIEAMAAALEKYTVK